MNAYFNRFMICLTKQQALSAGHRGRCDEDVAALLTDRRVRAQLGRISDTDLMAELGEYGTWDEAELSSRDDNEARIIWLAASNIAEDIRTRDYS